MSKKLGLALGAGGARGCAHIGFLQALEEEGIRPDIITGCSMGAVVGGAYASGMTVEDLLSTVRELKTSDLIDLDGMAITKLALFKGNKVRKILPKGCEILGAGSCNICKICAFPEPCRFPEKAKTSVEACGINVVSLAKTAKINYTNGENTVTYFSVVFANEP